MASLTYSAGDNIDWLWGSLKPWQILHSTLAERERNGSPLDVWELVSETLAGANTPNSTSRREEEVQAMQEQEVDKGGWAHRIKFLGDDGEFWRHGGIMESRVRDWLTRRHEDHTTNTELAIACCSSVAPVPQCYHDSSTIAQLEAADRVIDDGVDESSEESEAEEEENAGIGVGEDDDDDQGLPAEDNYDLISSNYEDDHGFSSGGECKLLVNRCCGAAAADDVEVGNPAKLAAEPYLEQEMVEEIEVCAVCLEKLNHEEEEAVQALACRHLFHRDCIAPWLERQPHACCPCCRAPILAPPQLHLAAPLNVAANRPSTCAGIPHHDALQRDIMGLLADMEAALEHLGFRS